MGTDSQERRTIRTATTASRRWGWLTALVAVVGLTLGISGSGSAALADTGVQQASFERLLVWENNSCVLSYTIKVTSPVPQKHTVVVNDRPQRTIEVAAGSTYRGTVRLPADGWYIIRLVDSTDNEGLETVLESCPRSFPDLEPKWSKAICNSAGNAQVTLTINNNDNRGAVRLDSFSTTDPGVILFNAVDARVDNLGFILEEDLDRLVRTAPASRVYWKASLIYGDTLILLSKSPEFPVTLCEKPSPTSTASPTSSDTGTSAPTGTGGPTGTDGPTGTATATSTAPASTPTVTDPGSTGTSGPTGTGTGGPRSSSGTGGADVPGAGGSSSSNGQGNQDGDGGSAGGGPTGPSVETGYAGEGGNASVLAALGAAVTLLVLTAGCFLARVRRQ